MPTRSYIVKENPDGTYTGIYCHCDGYLTHNGAMLIDHYATKERVDKLLSLGDLKFLAENIEPDPSLPHSVNEPQDGVCAFYGRDGGEKGSGSISLDLKELDDPFQGIDYTYVFGKDGKWRYFKQGELGKGLQSVEEDLGKEYEGYGFPRPPETYGFYTQAEKEKRKYDYEKSKEKEQAQAGI